MPRRRYFYRRTKPKQKWSINTNTYVAAVNGANAQCFSITSVPIVSTPSRNNNAGNPVSSATVISKVSHVKIKGVIVSGMTAGQTVLLALMYIPELINTDVQNGAMAAQGQTVFYSHPEWLMAWSRMDYTNAAQKNEFSLTTRLKRNLQPGDKIALVCYNINNSAGAVGQIDIATTASYCVRTN